MFFIFFRKEMLYFAFFLFSFLLFINPVVAVTATIVLGSAYWGIFKLVKQRLHAIGEAVTKDNYIHYRTADEAMSGIKDLKLHSSEDEFVKRFKVPSKKIHGYHAQKTVISFLPRYFFEVIRGESITEAQVKYGLRSFLK